MPTFTLSADQTDAVLSVITRGLKGLKNQPEHIDAALERIHAALDGKAEVPVFTVQFLRADGTVRAAEAFRRKESKHLNVETRLEQKANKEAALLLDGEALRIVSGDLTGENAGQIVSASDVLTSRGSEAALAAGLPKPKAKRVRTTPKKKAATVEAVEPVEAEVESVEDAEPVAV